MYVTLSFADLLGLMEATIAFLLAAMLLASDKKGVRWLAAFVAVLGFSFALAGIPVAGIPTWGQALLRWVYFSQLLAVPCLFQYAMLAVGNAKRPTLYHFLPAVFVAVISVPSWGEIVSDVLVGQLIKWLTLAQVVGYLTFIIYQVRGYRLRLKQQYSALTGIGLRWLEQICFWLLALVLFDILVFPVMASLKVPFETIQLAFNLCSSFYVIWLTRSALNQHILKKVPADKTVPSYEKSGLDDDTAGSLAAAVVEVMEVEKLYLKPNLVLADVSSAAGVSNHILSEVLNKTIGQNFYDFVNGYRVKAAQQLLGETNDTVLDIAFAAGFNNKVSFNQAFKKQVAMTPSQYRRSLAA